MSKPGLDRLWCEESLSAPPVGPASQGSGAWALLERADAWYRKLEWAEALRDYSRAVQEDQRLLPGWVGQSLANFHLADHSRAELLAAQGLANYPKSKQLLSVRGAALGRLGQRDQALACSDLSLSLEGDFWLEWALRGDLLLSLGGSNTPARHCFSRALELANDWLVSLACAFAWQEHGFAQEALTNFELPLVHNPETPELLFRYVTCLEQAGQSGSAYEAVTKLLALAPRDKRCLALAERLKPKGLLAQLGRLFRHDEGG